MWFSRPLSCFIKDKAVALDRLTMEDLSGPASQLLLKANIYSACAGPRASMIRQVEIVPCQHRDSRL